MVPHSLSQRTGARKVSVQYSCRGLTQRSTVAELSRGSIPLALLPNAHLALRRTINRSSSSSLRSNLQLTSSPMSSGGSLLSCTNQFCNNRYCKYCVGKGNTTTVTFHQLVYISSGPISPGQSSRPCRELFPIEMTSENCRGHSQFG